MNLILQFSFAAISRVSRRNFSLSKPAALKLCKQDQHVEECAVSRVRSSIFHTLINTCVENLILQKYSYKSSAQFVPLLFAFLTPSLSDVTVAHRIS